MTRQLICHCTMLSLHTGLITFSLFINAIWPHWLKLQIEIRVWTAEHLTLMYNLSFVAGFHHLYQRPHTFSVSVQCWCWMTYRSGSPLLFLQRIKASVKGTHEPVTVWDDYRARLNEVGTLIRTMENPLLFVTSAKCPGISYVLVTSLHFISHSSLERGNSATYWPPTNTTSTHLLSMLRTGVYHCTHSSVWRKFWGWQSVCLHSTLKVIFILLHHYRHPQSIFQVQRWLRIILG